MSGGARRRPKRISATKNPPATTATTVAVVNAPTRIGAEASKLIAQRRSRVGHHHGPGGAEAAQNAPISLKITPMVATQGM